MNNHIKIKKNKKLRFIKEKNSTKAPKFIKDRKGFYNDCNIKTKLRISFSSVMIPFTITIVVSILIGLFSINKINEFNNNLYSLSNSCQVAKYSICSIENNMFKIIKYENSNSKQDEHLKLLNKDSEELSNCTEIFIKNKNVDEDLKKEWLNCLKKLDKSKKDFTTVCKARVGKKTYDIIQNNYISCIDSANVTIQKLEDNIKLIVSNFIKSCSTEVYLLNALLLLCFIFGSTMAFIVVRKLTISITKPVIDIGKVSNDLANGKLNSSINYKSKDELGKLSQNIKTTTNILSSYIGDISNNLEKLANGDMNIEFSIEYVGEFSKIKNSMVGISNSLNESFYMINQSTEQVASGAEQVASGAQELSQGAVEQSCAIDRLSDSINDITEEAQNNSNNAIEARRFSEEVQFKVDKGHKLMREMLDAMKDINKMSAEIGKIVKNIDSIAFQTNILSLNAAVEAARAGEAGRGFSVVADEVGVLSKKSAESAHSTTMLINDAVDSINKGTAIAEETAKALEEIVGVTQKSSDIISSIAKGTDKQMESISQVAIGVEQITAVVQTNSATAEESAAASEELSGQAASLKNELLKFKLKEIESESSI